MKVEFHEDIPCRCTVIAVTCLTSLPGDEPNTWKREKLYTSIALPMDGIVDPKHFNEFVYAVAQMANQELMRPWPGKEGDTWLIPSP